MRMIKLNGWIFAALLTCAVARSADAPALDAQKYPQDTPQNAFGSIIKALESKDVTYWLAWLVTPADKERLLKKYGTIEKIVERNNDPKTVEKISAQCTAMKQMLADKKTTEGETDGIKWVRFAGDSMGDKGTRVLQLNKQADGRWTWAMLVHSDKDPVSPPPPPEKPAETK